MRICVVAVGIGAAMGQGQCSMSTSSATCTTVEGCQWCPTDAYCTASSTPCPTKESAVAAYPNTPTAASEKAKTYYDEQKPTTPGECDHYCAVWYGLSSSGWASAAANWAGTPSSHRLSGYEEGALAFWTGGGGGYGHCTIGSPKTDTIFSTDFPKSGFVGHTTVAGINSAWGNLKFAGWAKAYFPNAVTFNGTALNATANAV
jgi:hypothetical protein